jgi:hypothetical protein
VFFQAAGAPAQAPAVQIQIAPAPPGGGAGGVSIGYGGFGNGLSVLDTKGLPLELTGMQSQGNFAPGGKLTLEHTMVFQLKKDQEPAKLVLSGSRIVPVEVPFTLKDVPVR